MQRAKVSVIMAVYNSERYLRKALDTLLNQTLQDIEIICVDDGSGDGSFSILKEYEKKDKRIRVLQHLEKTPGAAEARNMGMDVACGKYLSFLDADDFFEPDMLKTVYEDAEKSKSDVTIFDGYLFDNRVQCDRLVNWLLVKDNLPEKKIFSPDENVKALFLMTLGAAWNMLFRREMVQKNKIRFISAYITDDQVFVYLSLCYAARISVVDQRLLHWRHYNAESQTGKSGEHPEAGFAASVLLMDEMKKRGLYEQYKLAFVNMALRNAIIYLDLMREKEKFEYLYYALKEKYFEELDISSTNEDDLYLKEDIERRQWIETCPADEFLLRNAIAQRERINDVINEIVDNQEKNQGILDLTKKWFTNGYGRRKLALFKKCNKIEHVIVYGYGVLGRILYTELSDMQIGVKAVIDKSFSNAPENIVNGLTEWKDDLSADAVIVTALSAYNEIEKMILSRNESIKVYSMEEILSCEENC